MKHIMLCIAIMVCTFSYAQNWQQVGSGIDGNVICMVELDGKMYVGGNLPVD